LVQFEHVPYYSASDLTTLLKQAGLDALLRGGFLQLRSADWAAADLS
jgi:hypothetical protein